MRDLSWSFKGRRWACFQSAAGALVQDLFDDTSYSYAPFIVLTFSAGSFGGYVDLLCCIGVCEGLGIAPFVRKTRTIRRFHSSDGFVEPINRLTGVLWWYNSVTLIQVSRNTTCVFFRALHLTHKIAIVSIRRRRTNQYRHQKKKLHKSTEYVQVLRYRNE